MDAQPAGGTRGTVIKVPDASPGILFVNGQQQYFTLDRVWKSPVAPTPNMTVTVEFDGSGAITAVTVVDSQQLNKERMNQLSSAAQQHGKEAAKLAQQGVGALAGKMGAIPLGVTVLMWIGMFAFPAVSMAGILGTKGDSFTFWQGLGIEMGSFGPSTSGHGFATFLVLICFAVPFAVPFIKVPWANYLNAAPLAAVILGAIVIKSQIPKEASDFFSLAWGIYVLGILGLVLAALALKKTPAQSH